MGEVGGGTKPFCEQNLSSACYADPLWQCPSVLLSNAFQHFLYTMDIAVNIHNVITSKRGVYLRKFSCVYLSAIPCEHCRIPCRVLESLNE